VYRNSSIHERCFMGSLRTVLVSLLAGMGIVLAIVASFLVGSHAGVQEAEGIHIRGIGNSGNMFGGAGHWGVARRLHDLNLAPPVSDEDVIRIHAAILSKAREGDLDCAAVVLDLCARQRRKPAAP
jgi:hypothetical protein